MVGACKLLSLRGAVVCRGEDCGMWLVGKVLLEGGMMMIIRPTATADAIFLRRQ